MRKILASFAIVLMLSGCAGVTSITTAATTTVTAEQISSAKDVAYGLEASYGASLSAAIAWGHQPTCGTYKAPPPPACKTLNGLNAIENVRIQFRSALDRLNATIRDTTTTTSVLTAAISAAKQAWATYQDVAAANNVR